jgi:hypothetical protein
MSAARTLTGAELEALLERAAERGAARALESTGAVPAARRRRSERPRRVASAEVHEAGEWLDGAEMCRRHDRACVYLLLWRDAIVYVGQTGDLCERLLWHRSYKRFDRVRALPIFGSRRVRTLVERRVRELVGETFYESGESARDRVEMEREGPPVDVDALAGVKPVQGVEALLRWLLS